LSKVEEFDLLPLLSNAEKRYSIVALEVDGNCTYRETYDEIENQPQYEKYLNNMDASLDAIAKSELGPRLYQNNSSFCHQIKVGKKITKLWQFRKGKLRLLWFYGRGKMVVCSHCFVKVSQKTPQSEIDKALNLLKIYENTQ
jgi:phage-related protein